jgi:hypothetical protein
MLEKLCPNHAVPI